MATQTITNKKTRFTFWFSISLLAGFVSLMATGCSGSAIPKERASQPSSETVSNQAAITQQTTVNPTTREDSAPVTDWSAQQDPSAAIAIDLVNAIEADIRLSQAPLPLENPPSTSALPEPVLPEPVLPDSGPTDSSSAEPNLLKKKSAPNTVPVRFDVTPEITPDDVLMRAEGRNITYAQQPFEWAIFNQLRKAGFCNGIDNCSNVSYLFNDVILSAQTFEQVSADITVIPHQPVSKEVALAYARILDTGASIDFVTAQVDQDISTETYFERGLPSGLPSSESTMALGSTKMAQLRMTPSGTVSEISFSYIVF
ncbi:MAG: hypothetical protein AAGC93_06180 [Cyanobacteria bacterium P01_F01_bin.53]